MKDTEARRDAFSAWLVAAAAVIFGVLLCIAVDCRLDRLEQDMNQIHVEQTVEAPKEGQ